MGIPCRINSAVGRAKLCEVLNLPPTYAPKKPASFVKIVAIYYERVHHSRPEVCVWIPHRIYRACDRTHLGQAIPVPPANGIEVATDIKVGPVQRQC